MLACSLVTLLVVLSVSFGWMAATEQSSVLATCTGSITLKAYQALESLFNATAGSAWQWDKLQPSSTHWHFPSNLTAPCSDSWQGLECVRNLNDTSTCEIHTIMLGSYNMQGTIPSVLGNLVNLVALELDGNWLEGTMPTELGNLVKIEQLYLYSTLLSGTIPSELGNLANLEQLYLYETLLDGTMPTELGNLVKIEQLYLYSTLLSGTIPLELGNLVNMQRLYVYSTFLEGTVPSEIGLLVAMEALYLNENMLNGTLPPEFGNLLKMEVLDLDSNSLCVCCACTRRVFVHPFCKYCTVPFYLFFVRDHSKP
jgi:Leucine-rich repeat (LRR) protein